MPEQERRHVRTRSAHPRLRFVRQGVDGRTKSGQGDVDKAIISAGRSCPGDRARVIERLFATTDADDRKRLRLLDGHYGHAIVAQTDAVDRLHLQISLTCHIPLDAARSNASPAQVILHRDRP